MFKRFTQITFYAVLISLVAVLIWHIWHYRKYTVWIIPAIILAGWLIFVTGFYIYILMAVIAGLILFGTIYLLTRHYIRPLIKLMLTGGIILTILASCLYLFRTTNMNLPKVVDVKNATYYIDEGIFTQVPYLEYVAVPTPLTKPDAVYHITLDNGKIKLTDKIWWSKTELAWNKAKWVKTRITSDEFYGFSQSPYYVTDIYITIPERNSAYFVLPIIYFLCWAVYWMNHKKPEVIEGEYSEVKLG